MKELDDHFLDIVLSLIKKRLIFAFEAITVLRFNTAGVAQLVEQLICNQQVAGSSPIASSRRRYNICCAS